MGFVILWGLLTFGLYLTGVVSIAMATFISSVTFLFYRSVYFLCCLFLMFHMLEAVFDYLVKAQQAASSS